LSLTNSLSYTIRSPLFTAVLIFILLLFLIIPRPPISTLFPYTTLFRSSSARRGMLFCNDSGYARSTGYSSRFHYPSRRHPLGPRSEEHTSELQSRVDLVCRLLLEKKKNTNLIRLKDMYGYNKL